ncbi:MAG: dimethyladenosine transferase [Symbiobacteriaceae bacterium]|nr:dimethyladenosine transferase [Symbiobacteriaceae bacterium]
MLDLSSAKTLKAMMAAHGIRPQHRLGQNFLTDARVLEGIVEAAQIGSEDLVLEIGPGLGTLTQQLARVAGKVLAIELDRNLVEILRKTLLEMHPNVELIHGDAGRIDLHSLLAERLPAGAKAKVAANLPYYITTPLIMRLLEEQLPLDTIVVMVQKEVADRMVAPPGGKDYGALSVAVQYYTEPRIAVKVSRGAFLPPPEVDSAVVAMKIREVPPVDAPRKDFFRVVKAAFGQRRKALGNALSGGLSMDKAIVQEALSQAQIDSSRRGETLSLEEFSVLTRKIIETGSENPPEAGNK